MFAHAKYPPRILVRNIPFGAAFIHVRQEGIMQILDKDTLDTTEVKPILSVVEFCRRYRLDEAEEKRLRKLFGDFASRHELLMNAHRKPVFR